MHRKGFNNAALLAIYRKLARTRKLGGTRRTRNNMQFYVGGRSGSGSLNLDGDMAEPPMERIERLAGENAVVVFSVSSCCICHVVKSLFCSLGVSPTVYELDEEMCGQQLKDALGSLVGDPAVPAVFVGGKLVGGLERVMSTHISGALVPLLKEAGALWL